MFLGSLIDSWENYRLSAFDQAIVEFFFIFIYWESVCMPKKEGGLELKVIEGCNKVVVLKHIWNLAMPYLKFAVGDGKHVFLWHDWWHPEASLYEKYG